MTLQEKTRPAMRYGRISGIEKPVSQLVLGSMVLNTDRLPESFALLDHFYELGGNAIDTAFVYGGGKSEPAVGQWITERGLRDQIVLVAKGAATSEATPEIVTQELMISLERFGWESADLYLMHRDNPNVPVGEFVDCLNEHRTAGRFQAFGGSNWTPERLQEANEYAARKGVPGFTASSPNFSLALWNEPMWGGCVAASDTQSRTWYQESGVALLAWSSQASGFFTGRFQPEDAEKPEASEVARVWFSPDNWERLRRAERLGERYGVSALQIALAYVLCQPFAIWALVGPQKISEIDSSVQSLEVSLTPEELAWLNLESETIHL